MTPEVGQLLKELKISNKSVLDIGSKDINGSLKDHCTDCDYIGLDLTKFKGVNIVGMGDTLPFKDFTFDVVGCLHVLGHDKNFWQTLNEIYRVVKPGGLVILTAPKFNFPTCEACPDYYRFSRIAFKRFFKPYANVSIKETEQSYVGWGFAL